MQKEDIHFPLKMKVQLGWGLTQKQGLKIQRQDLLAELINSMREQSQPGVRECFAWGKLQLQQFLSLEDQCSPGSSSLFWQSGVGGSQISELLKKE